MGKIRPNGWQIPQKRGILANSKKTKQQKAQTKRVEKRQKAQRTGDGGSPVRVGLFENHFRAPGWKRFVSEKQYK